jgi:hypothetical protein
MLAIGNGSGVVLFSSENLRNLIKLTEWNLPNNIQGTVEEVIISKDSKFIIATVRYYGIMLL